MKIRELSFYDYDTAPVIIKHIYFYQLKEQRIDEPILEEAMNKYPEYFEDKKESKSNFEWSPIPYSNL